MEYKIENITVQSEFGTSATIEKLSNEKRRFIFTWDKGEVCEEPDGSRILLSWNVPIVDIQYSWHPDCRLDRRLRVDWESPVVSELSSSAPIYCFYNSSGVNRYACIASDAVTRIEWNFGVHEEDATILCRLTIDLGVAVRDGRYEITLCEITRPLKFGDVLRIASRWWREECGYHPMDVPEIGREPFYSCWYSLHQNVTTESIELEAKLAKDYGMRTIIVDDGWQTDDNNRGYTYCGDWEVCRNKIPDMAGHVTKVHKLGMKYMIWFSVPFVGIKSKHWEHFKDKILYYIEPMGAGVLDPRYKEVRDYLENIYVGAMKDWNLDGIKLDFIDSFEVKKETAVLNEQMDVPDLQKAIQRLMTEIKDGIRAVKPDALIEFRQSYIGPAIHTFGNLFRVLDCPCDPITNRVGIIDMRLLGGYSAVHSDMLLWNNADLPETVANQIINILFGVPQISVHLENLPEEHKKVLKFWLDFMKKNEKILQESDLQAGPPQELYPYVIAEKGRKAIAVIYNENECLELPASADEIILINGTKKESLYIRTFSPLYIRSVKNCFGEDISSTVPFFEIRDLAALPVPCSGLCLLGR